MLEWVEAILYMIGKYFVLIALIPIVLIIGSFIIYPFETINEKIFKKVDDPNGNKFTQWLLVIASLVVTAIPIIIVIYLF
jgi:hypothetical protein